MSRIHPKWKLDDDDNTWNEDLHNKPFYYPTRASPSFNLLFAALWDLILTRFTKMGILESTAASRKFLT